MKFLIVNNYNVLLDNRIDEIDEINEIFMDCNDPDLFYDFLEEMIDELEKRNLINLILIIDLNEINKTLDYIVKTYKWKLNNVDDEIYLIDNKLNIEYKVMKVNEYKIELEDIIDNILNKYLSKPYITVSCKNNLKKTREIADIIYNAMIEYIFKKS